MQAVTRQYNAVHDFSATVDLVPALGTTEKSHITEYKDVRGYIIFRKPAEIRIIGLYPVVRNKLFDMVSDGTDFKLYITPKNRFIRGRNEIEQPSANKLENLRPQHFLDALLVRPVDASDKVLLENFTDEDNAFYVLHVIRENGGGQLQLMRTIWFNRLDLLMARQLIFDEAGNILTDARYAQWKAYDNVSFPKHVEINRPRDEYAVVIDIVKRRCAKFTPSNGNCYFCGGRCGHSVKRRTISPDRNAPSYRSRRRYSSAMCTITWFRSWIPSRRFAKWSQPVSISICRASAIG